MPDRISRNQFAETMLEKLDEENEFLRKIIFSDETKFRRFREGKAGATRAHEVRTL
jgi:hypothetical protein